jgi:hypothetical protein
MTAEQLKWLQYSYRLIRAERDDSTDPVKKTNLTNALAGLLLVHPDALM